MDPDPSKGSAAQRQTQGPARGTARGISRGPKFGSRVEVAWNVAGELSAAHAAYVVATGAKCTDPKTESLLIDPVAQINTRLVNESIDVGWILAFLSR